MAIIRRGQIEGREAAGVRLDLGDLERHAEQIRAIAAEQAERILVEARAERERLISSAAELGFAKGLAAGREQGLQEGLAAGKADAVAQWQERLGALQQSFAAAMHEFEQSRERMLFEARQDVLTLALLLTQKVTHRVIQCDPEIVVEQLSAALGTLTKPTSVVVAIHPDDEPVASEALPMLMAQITAAKHTQLVVDASLQRGSCVVRTAGGGVIDASIKTQLERIVDALAPAGPRGEPARHELSLSELESQPRDQSRPDGGAVAA